MRVAIVGGTGLVGRQLAAELSARGDGVVSIARHPSERAAPEEFRAADVERAPGDGLAAAIDGCAAVVSSFGTMRQSGEHTFRDVHVRGLAHLVEACRARGVRRLVHLSALSASGSSKSAWLRSKRAGEELLGRAALDVTILRPSAIYGPGDDFVVPLAALLRRIPFAPLPGDGRALLQPIAARDVALAVAHALAHDDTIGLTLDLAGPDVVTIADVYDRVMAAAGLRRPKLRVPYALIEPLGHLLREAPGTGFSFDQLAVLEEERPADPRPTARRLGLDLVRFTVDSIRGALHGGEPPRPAAG